MNAGHAVEPVNGIHVVWAYVVGSVMDVMAQRERHEARYEVVFLRFRRRRGMALCIRGARASDIVRHGNAGARSGRVSSSSCFGSCSVELSAVS